jgi:cytochrome oxidase Cu insertion factor (SCO1/SenC/PrrC family)
MPGMNSGLNIANPILVAAFRAALMHQGLIALLILATLAITWASIKEWLPRLAIADRHAPTGQAPASQAPASQAPTASAWLRPSGAAEPAGRSLLRTGFGLLWIFDGILQAQPAMVAGLPSKIIAPAAASSPAWVQHIANWAGTAWSYHPIQASAAAVWIQVGIGVWLVAAARGPWSHAAGLASAGWGLLVWVFGEAFGGVFGPGLTVLFGAPGAALFYCVAGGLVALPERFWQAPTLGRRMVSGLGLFFVGMAVLQAWPGRGFWQGTTSGRQPGILTTMIRSMSGIPQPSMLARWVSGFAAFTAQHGFAVNLFAVVALATIGALLLTRQPRLIRPAITVLAVFCLADWVLIEDVGFLGGLGTDPNNMIPLLLVVFAGYLAMTRLPAPVTQPVTAPASAVQPGTAQPGSAEPGRWRPDWRDRLHPRRLARTFASAGPTGILAGWAAALVLLGAAPMALAQANPNADPIIAQAIDGASTPINFAAPGFALTDQHGHQVSLASLHGKVVLMTFLDPVCTTDCPLIAQEFRAADRLLGARAADVRLVAIATNPLYYTARYVQAFDRQERLTGLRNWFFLTGSLSQLHQVWQSYGISAVVLPAGQMVAHNDLAFVIDRGGRVRTELNFEPGPGTTTSVSSFAVELSQAAESAISPSRSPS